MQESRTETINIRVKEGEKQFLQRAAMLAGENLSSFMLKQAEKEAHRRLAEVKRVEVSLGGMKSLIEAIENPGEPNDKLQNAALRFKKEVDNGKIRVGLRKTDEKP